MDIKYNDATPNRPEGERVIDAPYVYVNLPSFIGQLKEEKAWEKSDRNSITVFKTADMAIVLTALKEGAVIKDNTVDGLTTIQVLEGALSMETLEGDGDMGEKNLMVFHPGIPHSLEATVHTILLITTVNVK